MHAGGLPNAFLEAAAHGCAILSAVNPDGFAAEFELHAAHGQFAEGLRHLLENRRLQQQGARGWRDVKRHVDRDHALGLQSEWCPSLLKETA